ncbi:MAG: PIG-L family deacetylase [Salinivirgaceae bacterium]
MNRSKKAKSQLLIATILAFVLVLLFFGARMVKMRAFSYPYNPQSDYQYTFNTENARIVELCLSENRLDLSQVAESYQTAFIEMAIQYNLKGFASEPEVKMTDGTDTLFQNFECRTQGIRYLNISQLLQNEAKEIQFSFTGCKPKNKSVKLIAYKNVTPEREKILILSPHPDDAEIAAYGLYASNPKNTFIATITAGEAGSMRYNELYSDSTAHYLKKGQLRVWNSITVPMLGGMAPEKCINLGYFDASLAKMYRDTLAHGFSKYLKTDDINLFRSNNCHHLPDSLKPESTWRSLVNDLKYLLLKEKPTIIVTTYPAHDWHNDHKFTTVALLQTMKELPYNQCELWLYTNHLPLTEMYPDGKVGSQTSLPPNFGNQQMYFEALASYPLAAQLQAEKTLALDAMNDLRPNTQYRNTKASWLQFKQNFFDKLYLKESDYFRRSVRSSELFFVIDGKSALQPEIQTKIIGEL